MTAVPMFQAEDATLRHRMIIFGAVLAAALIGFGLILWVAANWDDMSRMTRLAIVGGSFALGCLAAMAHPALRLPGALVAFAAMGGLFALIGQIYQSGADPWQLFALWAALSLPLALAARHDAIWLPWAIVALAGVSLWMGGRNGAFIVPDRNTILLGWAMSVAVVAGLAVFGMRSGETRWSWRTAALLTIIMILTTALAMSEIFSRGSTLPVLGIIVLAAMAAAFFFMRPRPFGLLAAATLAIDILLIWVIARPMLRGSFQDFSGFLLIGLVSAAIIGGSASLLLRLNRWNAADDANEGRNWPVTVLSGIGAVIAAIPLLLFLGLTFTDLFKSASGSAFVGLVLLGAAILLLRSAGPLTFRQQFAFIAMVVAFAPLSIGLYGLVGIKHTGLAMALIYIVTAVLAPPGWVRGLLGFSTAGALAFWLDVGVFGSIDMIMRSPAWMVLAIAGAAALYLVRQENPPHPMLPPFISGFAVGCLVALMMLAGQTFLLGGVISLPFGQAGMADWMNIRRAIGIATALAGVALLALRGGPAFRTPLALAIFAIVLIFSFLTTPLGPAVLLLAMALATGRNVIAALGVIACLWIIGSFYYWLGWPLEKKAYLLVVLGAALAAVTALTRRAPLTGAMQPARAMRPALAAGLVALSGIATGAIAGKTVSDKEAILRDGQRIFVALAPVDPRSLMQGDYMALRFALPSVPRDMKPTHALATIDAKNIATVTQLLDKPAASQPGAIIFVLKQKDGRPMLGTDAWFFREGRAKTFEAARFGEFRVGPTGEMILTGMADKDLNLLQ